MQGLTPTELQELLAHIEKHHSWKNMYENNYIEGKNNKIIKYVDFSFDTRTCEVWHIEFRSVFNSKEYHISFRTEESYNLKSRIYEWLKGET